MISEKESKLTEVRQYEALENLTQQDGWPILVAHLEKVKSVLVEALLIEKDFNKIITLQERHRAFSSIIMTIQSAKTIKEKLHHDIQLLIEDELNIREYDL